MKFKKKPPKIKAQLELPLVRPRQPDRNHSSGGRSFYFFDFDDNVVYLPTLLFLFHNETNEEKSATTREFAAIKHQIGQEGPWKNYELRHCPQTGSFRRFRQKKLTWLERLRGQKQPLIEDLLDTLKNKNLDWRGPSWDFFWHAVHNGRPLSIITARGHSSKTIKDGISLLVKNGHLSQEPNYLSIYAVSNLDVRRKLGDTDLVWQAAKLKQIAIQRSVEEAFRQYGSNPTHRFGMSDDDPTNIKLIIEAMRELKFKYPKNSFFVIDTQHGGLVKQEILTDSIERVEGLTAEQLHLFDD